MIGEISCHKCGTKLVKKLRPSAYSYKVWECPNCEIAIRIDTGYRYDG